MTEHRSQTRAYVPPLIVLEIELETCAGSTLNLPELQEPAE